MTKKANASKKKPYPVIVNISELIYLKEILNKLLTPSEMEIFHSLMKGLTGTDRLKGREAKNRARLSSLLKLAIVERSIITEKFLILIL